MPYEGLLSPMKSPLEKAFLQGRFNDLLGMTIDSPDYEIKSGDEAYFISALAVTGRLEEAHSYDDSLKVGFRPEQRAMCQFYIAIGYIRQGDYKSGTRYLVDNLILARKSGNSRCLFYAHQGRAFFHHIRSRFHLALAAARTAQAFAIKENFFLGRAFSADLIGHALVMTGQVTRGLQELEKAHQFLLKLNNAAHAHAVYAAIIGYQAQFFQFGAHTTSYLEKVIEEGEIQENSYTLSYLYLELARQCSLRGELRKSEDNLQKSAALVHSSSNLSHQSALLLFRAQNHFQKGAYERAVQLVEEARMNMNQPCFREEMHLLGLKKKCFEKLDKAVKADDCLQKLKVLARKTHYDIGRRMLDRPSVERSWNQGDDLLGDLIDEVHRSDISLNDKISRIIDAGTFSLLYELLPLDREKRYLFFKLKDSSITVFDRGEVFHQPSGMSQQGFQVLQLLSQGIQSKQELIEKVWGYTYHPMRHDPLVYSMVARLRTVLGDYQHWLVCEHDGYSLSNQVDIRWLELELDLKKADKTALPVDNKYQDLNHRQVRILEYIRDQGAVNLQDCLEIFQVSKVTASRDLSHLFKCGFVTRLGKGKATKYLLSVEQ